MPHSLKHILVFALALLACLPSAAASKEAKARYEAITSDSSLIFGEGFGATNAAADKAALLNLTGKITVTVQGQTEMTEQQTDTDGQLESSSTFSSMVKSYSGATLNNAEYLLMEDSPQFHVVRYMKRSDMEAIFTRRADRVADYVRSAIRAEEKAKVDDALKYLNRAYILLHSLRDPNEISMDIDGENRLLVNFIPEKMKEICGKVKIGIAGVKGQLGEVVDLAVTYDGRPATSLDFTYFDGRNWSGIYSAKDGRGELDLSDPSKLEKLQINIEYEYRGECNSDKELAPLVDAFPGLPVRNSYVTLSDKADLKVDRKARNEFNKFVGDAAKDGVAALGSKDAAPYSAAVESIIKAVSFGNYDNVRDRFTDSGWEMFQSLLKYGKARIVGKPEYSFHPMGERVVCRSVPMSFDFPSSGRKFIEDVTFTFGTEGKVESLAFGLGNVARTDIFSQGGDAWTDLTKMTIVTFLENYKTAFALKRRDYIESIFDDNAYIIVGHVVKKMVQTDRGDGRYELTEQQDVNYANKSKREYMENLRHSFAANEFINVRFADNDVMKAGYGGETFGIQIKQEYNSSNYGDMGYLFLLVDLNEPDRPVIQVRTWQPDRNPDLTPNLPKSSRDYGIFSTASFN